MAEDLIDAFNWDDVESVFPPPVTKTKEQEQEELLQEVKGEEKGRVKKTAKVEDGESSESKHDFFEDFEGESTKGESTEDKTGNTEKPGSSKTTKTGDEPVDSNPEVKEDKNKDQNQNQDNSDNDPDDKDFFKTLAQELKEKNIFSAIEIDENEEIDEEKFFELHEQEVQARADEIFEGVFTELKNDPDAVAFLQFKRTGGSTFDFFNKYRETNNFPETIDITKKADQIAVIKKYLLDVKEVDPADLDEEVEFFTEKGDDKLKETAEKYYKKIQEKDTAERLALVSQQAETEKKVKKATEDYRTGLKETLKAGTGEASFKFDAEDQKTLVDYITKPTTKIGANRYLTDFQVKLGEFMKSPKGILTLAKLVRKGFDVPDLKKEVKNQVVKETKSKLLDLQKNDKKRSTSSSEKSLADYF